MTDIITIRDSVALEIYKRSSAYNDALCSAKPLRIPECPLAVLDAMAKGLIVKANNKGDKGQPCLFERPRGK